MTITERKLRSYGYGGESLFVIGMRVFCFTLLLWFQQQTTPMNINNEQNVFCAMTSSKRTEGHNIGGS